MKVKLSDVVFKGFLFLVAFDFATKDIFIHFALPLDGIKVQIYKVYVLFLFVLSVVSLAVGQYVSLAKLKLLKGLMLFWVFWGVCVIPIFFLVADLSSKSIMYFVGDSIGWFCIPVFFFLMYRDLSDNKLIEQRLSELFNFMRFIIFFGLFKFFVLKFAGYHLIPMGLPIYFFYLSCILFLLFKKDFLPNHLKIEKKYLHLFLGLTLFLILVYAQRTQIIIFIVALIAFYITYSGAYLKKFALFFLVILIGSVAVMYLPETIYIKFAKLANGSGTLLPNGFFIPFVTLDNSLTQRVYESLDVVNTLDSHAIWWTGGGNGFSFINGHMKQFKEFDNIHHVHVSYFAILLRVGLVGLLTSLAVLFWAMTKVFSEDPLSKVLGVSVICLAIDYAFFQRFYYSFELPFTLAMLATTVEKRQGG